MLLYSDDIDHPRRRPRRPPAGARRATSSRRRGASARRPRRSSRRWTPAGFDVVVLDGEAAPAGGLGLCRQLKNEIFRCPPILVLTGRPQDGWLAGWSLADDAVPHPLDPIAVAEAVAELARTRVAVG